MIDLTLKPKRYWEASFLRYRTKAAALEAAKQFRNESFPPGMRFGYDLWCINNNRDIRFYDKNIELPRGYDNVWCWALKIGSIFAMQSYNRVVYAYVSLSDSFKQTSLNKFQHHGWSAVVDWHDAQSNHYLTCNNFIMKHSKSPKLAVRRVIQEYRLYHDHMQKVLAHDLSSMNKIHDSLSKLCPRCKGKGYRMLITGPMLLGSQAHSGGPSKFGCRQCEETGYIKSS